jgi:tetratricopeptide (TPR) repeat protein/DNA-binding XRE family transcriptional regulator
MRRPNLTARMLRALSGETQQQFGEGVDVHPALIAQIEVGSVEPDRDVLRRMARHAGIAESDAAELIQLYERLRGRRRNRRHGAEDPVHGLIARLRGHVSTAYLRLLALPRPVPPPRAEDRGHAEEQWKLLESLTDGEQLAVVRVAEEYQNWALCEKVCDESERQASRTVEHAAALARLAQEIADHVRGPEEWCNRVRGYAAAQGANALRVAGELKAARAAFVPAKRLWHAGADPLGVLDPGRLLDLEASLCRDERRFAEALALLDEATAVGRSPERVLIKKGFTLEVMGEYGQAVETLLRAEPLVMRLGDARLLYMLRFNLGVNYTHVSRYGEATDLLDQVRGLAAGAEIEQCRVMWLEGRIAAGLGRSDEARKLLGEARRRFAAEKMTADAALALLEEAALLLDDGGTAEVKILARELAAVLKSKGVHREALAALRLFQEAAERETATAELARGVLHFLFRARHDQGLRYASS